MANEVGHRYGLLLPQFGAHASRDRLVGGGRAAEAYGFDSVWVRDHLVYRPHSFDDPDRTHLEPFVTLAAVAGATSRLILGTACLIPHRHPIHTALSLSSLEAVAGPGRVIAGCGAGFMDHEFSAVGLGGIKRGRLVREQVEIMRRLWTGVPATYEGSVYSFRDVDIHPPPSSNGAIPIWYCGESELSVRRAAAYADGWMPGRITLKSFRKHVELLRQLSEERGRAMPALAAMPLVSPGATREAALAAVPWREMMQAEFAAGRFDLPDSGTWETPADLDGALIAGPAADIIEVAHRYHEAGLDHLVFDLRARFVDWDECLASLGEEVLPELRASDAASPRLVGAPH